MENERLRLGNEMWACVFSLSRSLRRFLSRSLALSFPLHLPAAAQYPASALHRHIIHTLNAKRGLHNGSKPQQNDIGMTQVGCRRVYYTQYFT